LNRFLNLPHEIEISQILQTQFMNKHLLTFSIFCSAILIHGKIEAQTNGQKCGFDRMIDYQESLYPGYKENVNATYRSFLDRANNHQTTASKTTLVIPVVFHVVWNSASPLQNLDDSVLLEQIAVLNEDFSRSNADAANTRTEFLPIVSSADIQFELACKDPNGNNTNGIVRVETSTTFGGGFLPDMASISKIQNTVDGGSDAWNTAEYLNIWIGDINGGAASPSLLGIATPPAGLSNWPANSIPPELTDGAIIQFSSFSRNNPIAASGFTVIGRTVTHEVGHYLGTRHCAENTFGGFFGSICGDDDGLTDTPNCDQSSQGCDMARNSCVDNIPGTIGDLPDMVENYMDYSNEDCQNSFTVGQTTIMRNVLQNERAGLLTSPALNNCLPTAIILNNSSNELNIYPNPSNGTFTVNHSGTSNILIRNSLGQVISPTTITKENTTEIKIETKGIYFVTIESNKNSITKKVIVQ